MFIVDKSFIELQKEKQSLNNDIIPEYKNSSYKRPKHNLDYSFGEEDNPFEFKNEDDLLIKEEEFYDNVIIDKYLENKEEKQKGEDQKKVENNNIINLNRNNTIKENNKNSINIVNDFNKKSRNKKPEVKQQNSSEIIENLFKKKKKLINGKAPR